MYELNVRTLYVWFVVVRRLSSALFHIGYVRFQLLKLFKAANEVYIGMYIVASNSRS